MNIEERIKEIFGLALGKKSAAERSAYLAAACHEEPGLLCQVETLLRAHEQAGEFLGQTIRGPTPDFVTERTGTMIGRYKLLQNRRGRVRRDLHGRAVRWTPLHRRKSNPMKRAFTLIELLVVIAIIGILAALLLPVLSRAKAKAQGAICLNCGRQLMTAITLYTGDNNDLYPPNPDDGNTVPGHNWCAGQAGTGGPQEFNSDVLKDESRTLVISYLSGNPALFRCPADKRTGLYQGSNPAFVGTHVPASRSFSMNQAVGTICAQFDAGPSNHGGHNGAPRIPVNGPWLNNQFNHRRNSPWRTYGKSSAIGPPGPSMLWVILDEDVSGLNDAAFAVGMERPAWIDAPGTYHEGGCGFAFADGHSETHRWFSKAKKIASEANLTDPQEQKDWAWVRDRTSARAN